MNAVLKTMYEKFVGECCKCDDLECRLVQSEVINKRWNDYVEHQRSLLNKNK